MMVQICCRERERRLGGGEGSNSGMCVAGCWIGVSCEEEMRIYFDLNVRHQKGGDGILLCEIAFVSCKLYSNFLIIDDVA